MSSQTVVSSKASAMADDGDEEGGRERGSRFALKRGVGDRRGSELGWRKIARCRPCPLDPDGRATTTPVAVHTCREIAHGEEKNLFEFCVHDKKDKNE